MRCSALQAYSDKGLRQWFAPKQCDQARSSQIWAEGDRNITAMAGENHQGNAHKRAYQRREQDDQWQHLPAEPCTKRSKQLEITITHAFLAGCQLERPVHRPERQIAKNCSGHRVMQGSKNTEIIESQKEKITNNA